MENFDEHKDSLNEGQERTVLDQLQEHVHAIPPTNLVKQSEIFGKKKEKRQGFGAMVWMGLVAICLIIAIFAAYYWKIAPPVNKEVSISGPRQDLREVVDQFLEQAEKGGVMGQAAHQALFAYIQSLRKEDLPSFQVWKAYLDQKDIPDQYQYFFEEIITTYILGEEELYPIKGYTAYIDNNFVLSYPTPISKGVNLKLLKEKQSHAYSIAAAEINSLPQGLTMIDGSVINPVIAGKRGLVVIDEEGNISINLKNQLGDPLANLNIDGSLENYQQFLSKAQKDQADVFQADLLIYDGHLQFHMLDPYPDYIFFLSNIGANYLYKTNGEKKTIDRLIGTYGAIHGIGLYENGGDYRLVFE